MSSQCLNYQYLKSQLLIFSRINFSSADLVEEPQNGRRVVPHIHHHRDTGLFGRSPIVPCPPLFGLGGVCLHLHHLKSALRPLCQASSHRLLFAGRSSSTGVARGMRGRRRGRGDRLQENSGKKSRWLILP